MMMQTLVNLFISNAYADPMNVGPGANPQNSSVSFMIMIAIFFIFIYFAIWRPQNKRAKEQQELLNSLAKGDEVVTAGGILGRINKIADQYLILSLTNNVDIVVQKSSVVSVLPKGTLKSLE